MIKRTKKSDKVIIGHWYSKSEPDLPKPVPEKGRKNKLVLKRLGDLEAKARERHYKGWSTCRICSKKNGSSDFELTVRGITYVWPSGLSHYLQAHHIKPQQELYDMLDLQPKGK